MPKGGKRPGAGRPKGSTGAVNKLLKEAVIEAAAAVGEDGEGKGELVGYLTARAKDQQAAFMALLGKVMPMQVAGTDEDGEPTAVTIKFVGS